MNHPCVMVVDDDEALRESVCELLEEEGLRTLSADSGASALSRLREAADRPDLILLDLMMPLKNGWQFREEQLRDPELSRIPVVVMSASRDLRGITANEVVYKPVSLQKLLEVVHRHAPRKPSQDTKEEPVTQSAAYYAFSDSPVPNDLADTGGPLRANTDDAQGHEAPVDSLLDSSRTDAGRVQASYELVDLAALTREAPAPICVLRGRELVYEMANDLYLQICGKGDILGKPLAEALPEFQGQDFAAQLRDVLETGNSRVATAMRLALDRGDGVAKDSYWTLAYTPVRGPGGQLDRVMVFCSDVTDQVLARRAIERSEQRFRGLVTQVLAGIAEKDLEGRFILTNERYREIVGRSARELEQLRAPDITHPDDLKRSAEAFDRLVEHGTPFVIEKRYVKPDGSIVWVQNSVARIDDAAGVPYGVATVSVDITQRKYAERALKESEARYRTFFETAEVSLWEEDFSSVQPLVAAWVHDHGASLKQFLEANPAVVDHAVSLVRISDVNPATLRMFGASDKKQLLESLGAIFVAETRAVFVEELLALAEGRAVFESEATLQTLKGERIDVLVAMSFAPSNGNYDRVLVSLVDISAQKAAQREKDARLVEVERAVRFSEMFTGILGHDLRNPLSAIMHAASLLSRRAEDSERISKPVSRILTSADRMERMISQLLDFTHIRLGGGIPLERKALDLGDLCQLVIEEVETAWSTDIVVRCTGDLRGHWDGDRLSQLVSNLAGNACQHHLPSTPIHIHLDGSHIDEVHVEIRNEGVIAADLVPVIFEPLRQTSEPQQRRTGSSGLGLGLYITQQIALAHGGTIRVQSDDAQGTSFRVDLPRTSTLETDRAFSPGPTSTIPPGSTN